MMNERVEFHSLLVSRTLWAFGWYWVRQEQKRSLLTIAFGPFRWRFVGARWFPEQQS